MRIASGAYRRVLDSLGVRGDECILVEDMARNLPTAREFGIRTILVMDPHAVDQPSSWLPDPASQARMRECPADASICIPEIYQVAEAIRQLTNLPVSSLSSS